MDIMEIIRAKEFNADEFLAGLEKIKKLTYKEKELQPQEFLEVFFKHITEKFLNAAVKVGQVKEDSFIKQYGLPTIPIVEIKKDICSVLLKILYNRAERKEIVICYNNVGLYYNYCKKYQCIDLEKEFFKLTCSILKYKIRKESE